MAEIIILLGGNLGDSEGTFSSATKEIARRIGPVLAQSRDHWTEPWGFEDHRLFLNRAIAVDAHPPPDEVMRELLRIEAELGRVRSPGSRYAPRTIDLDILFIGSEVVEMTGLSVPHPRVHQRAFALAPAADIAPSLVHPLLGRTVLELLNDALQAR